MSLRYTNVIPWYFQLMVIFYALHMSMPILGFYTPAVVNVAVLLFLYFFLFLKRGHAIMADIRYVLPIFSVYILSLFYEGVSNFPKYIYGMAQLFIYPLLALYFIRNGTSKSVRRIFIVVGISYIITGITTYIGCQIFPNASRNIAAMLNSEDPGLYAIYMKYNIGSFSFIYTLVLILPLLVYLIRDKKINVIIGLICMVIIIMTILASEYTTALLFLFICLISFFIPKYFGVKKNIWVIIGVLVLFFAGKPFLGQILESLANAVSSETIADRLSNLTLFFTNGTQHIDGDLESRVTIYNLSMDAFFESPIWGSRQAKVGGHSYILDCLGKYGLLGLIAMVIMYRRMFNAFFKPWSNRKCYGYICLLFMIALSFAALNPKDNLVVLTFIVPLFVASYEENYNQ